MPRELRVRAFLPGRTGRVTLVALALPDYAQGVETTVVRGFATARFPDPPAGKRITVEADFGEAKRVRPLVTLSFVVTRPPVAVPPVVPVERPPALAVGAGALVIENGDRLILWRA